jgi:hypothetical protein
MLLAGKLAARDGSIDPDGWHQHAIACLKDVPDGPASEFLSGKQIQFLQKLNGYSGSWQARAQRPVYTTTNLVGLEVVYTLYHDNASNLKTKIDCEYKTKPVISTLLM